MTQLPEFGGNHDTKSTKITSHESDVFKEGLDELVVKYNADIQSAHKETNKQRKEARTAIIDALEGFLYAVKKYGDTRDKYHLSIPQNQVSLTIDDNVIFSAYEPKNCFGSVKAIMTDGKISRFEIKELEPVSARLMGDYLLNDYATDSRKTVKLLKGVVSARKAIVHHITEMLDKHVNSIRFEGDQYRRVSEIDETIVGE